MLVGEINDERHIELPTRRSMHNPSRPDLFGRLACPERTPRNFYGLCIVLTGIFTGASADDPKLRRSCTSLERDLLGAILAKKFGLERLKSVWSELDSGGLLSANVLGEIAKLRSPKRKFDVDDRLVRSFIDFEFEKYKTSRYSKLDLKKRRNL